MASQISCYTAALFSSTILAFSAPAFAVQDEQDDLPVYLEADTLVDIATGEGYIARGNVRVQQGDRLLIADELEYRPEENRVIARGNVEIHGQGEYPQYADQFELDNEMSTGIATGFATMMENNGRMAAATAARSADGSIRLDRAYYTACPLCENGEEEPTWRIRAREVVQDAEDQMIYYKDAQLEFLGVPVLYAPTFAHPDPSSERRSGFLFPGVGASSRLGFNYQQPYLWAISPHQDLVIAPRYMSNVNPLVYAEYRKRFWSGSMAFEGSFTREYEIDSDGERFGEEEDRWHVFGGGRFRITEDWRWGFSVQRASDELHLRRYDFSEIDQDRGAPLSPDTRRLLSQIYVEHRSRNAFGTLISASYQSLRSQADDEVLPDLLPVLEYRQVINAPDGWGRVNLGLSGTVLEREVGSDYQRLSSTIDWRTRWVGPAGIIAEPFAHGRVDAYAYSDIPDGNGGTYEDGFDRQVGLAGVEFSWPFMRSGEQSDIILEPVLSGVIATDDPVANRIINEDSLSIDLDETLLFQSVRAPGFDLWENGQRITAGVRATAYFGDDNMVRGFVGRSERLDGEAVFGGASGLATDSSDYVFSGEIDWGSFGAEFQTRLDSEDMDIDRLSFSASYENGRFEGNVRYTDISDDDSPRGPQREVIAGVSYQLTERWQLIGNVTQDLDLNTSRRLQAGFQYRDDCTQMEIVYERQDLGIERLGPSDSIQFRISLFTLGSVAPD